MAYTPKEWECGEIVTADSLNNIEEGIQEALGGGSSTPFLVGLRPQAEVDEGDEQLDKTFGELWNAYVSGRVILVHKVLSEYNHTYDGGLTAIYKLNSNGSWSATVEFSDVGSYSVTASSESELNSKYPYMTW